MYYLLPDYYDRFICSAENCQDNCCIGWEIMVDDVSWEKYQKISGAWGKRFCQSVADEPGNRHFILQNGRCPFLNQENRCDIILHFGEDTLCDICDEHPRFTFEYAGWMETGLGLCCEEAARLILENPEPAGFLCRQDNETESPLPENLQKALDRRWKLFALLQNRSYPLSVRLQALLTAEEAGKMPCSADWRAVLDFLKTQDFLTPEWPALLEQVQTFLQLPDAEQEKIRENFEINLGEQAVAYEQLAIYFLFRYYLWSVLDQRPAEKVRLTAASVGFIQLLAVSDFYSSQTLPDASRRLRLAQIFSKEVEYNDEALEGFQELLTLSLT